MTNHRVAACMVVSLAFALLACASEVDPVFDHGRLDLDCGPAGGGTVRIDLSSSPVSCDALDVSGSRTLTARAGRTLDEGTETTRFELASGQDCADGVCVGAVGGWFDVRRAGLEAAAEVTYTAELEDGRSAHGSATLPICERGCF